jgi:hypothetical protein
VPTFDPDQFRVSRLTAAGHRVRPLTFHDVEARPQHVVRTVERALARAAA